MGRMGLMKRAVLLFVCATSLAAGCNRSSPGDAATGLAAYPEKLSAWGLFVGDGASQEPVAGVIPYDINTPLFSDYSDKLRFVRLPAGPSVKA